MQCGIIEIVPNLVTLRVVLDGLLRERNQDMKDALTRYRSAVDNLFEARRTRSSAAADIKRKYVEFKDNYKPVLHRWWLQHFVDPAAWFAARLGFQRTIAVMSMVGYVVG